MRLSLFQDLTNRGLNLEEFMRVPPDYQSIFKYTASKGDSIVDFTRSRLPSLGRVKLTFYETMHSHCTKTRDDGCMCNVSINEALQVVTRIEMPPQIKGLFVAFHELRHAHQFNTGALDVDRGNAFVRFFKNAPYPAVAFTQEQYRALPWEAEADHFGRSTLEEMGLKRINKEYSRSRQSPGWFRRAFNKVVPANGFKFIRDE